MSDWQPIETAPKDGTKILAHWFGNDMPFISVIWWRGDKYPDSLFPWRNASNDSAIGGHGQCHLPASQQTWRQGPYPLDAAAAISANELLTLESP